MFSCALSLRSSWSCAQKRANSSKSSLIRVPKCKFIETIRIFLGFFIWCSYSWFRPTGLLHITSAKKFSVPHMCTISKLYSCICKIQQVILLDVSVHFFRKGKALSSEYTLILCPKTYSLNFCSV